MCAKGKQYVGTRGGCMKVLGVKSTRILVKIFFFFVGLHLFFVKPLA